MEISAIISPSFTPSPASETRAAQAAAENARNKGRGSDAVARGTSQDAPEQTATRADTLPAIRETLSEQAIQRDVAGAIQIEMEDGTRILKVLDSKEVLIYQVPSKGELALVNAEEAAARRMLASA